MALINCDFFAETLGISTSMTVILPQKAQGQIGMDGAAIQEKCPVLYLLHGLSDDHTIWLRRTSIERYVASFGIAVVMPNVHRSFYSNMVYGGRYWDFISEELPRIVQSFFPVSGKREDTFAAGLSMGGYGALKLGLRQPHRFAAVASLSGVTDLVACTNHIQTNDFRNIFGDVKKIQGSDDDLFKLLSDFKDKADQLPRIYQCCGTEDFLYEDNLRFKAEIEKFGIDYQYVEGPGVHSWEFWDAYIQKVLAWMNV